MSAAHEAGPVSAGSRGLRTTSHHAELPRHRRSHCAGASPTAAKPPRGFERGRPRHIRRRAARVGNRGAAASTYRGRPARRRRSARRSASDSHGPSAFDVAPDDLVVLRQPRLRQLIIAKRSSTAATCSPVPFIGFSSRCWYWPSHAQRPPPQGEPRTAGEGSAATLRRARTGQASEAAKANQASRGPRAAGTQPQALSRLSGCDPQDTAKAPRS